MDNWFVNFPGGALWFLVCCEVGCGCVLAFLFCFCQVVICGVTDDGSFEVWGVWLSSFMGLGLFWGFIFVLLVCVVVVFSLCVLLPALVFACSVIVL